MASTLQVSSESQASTIQDEEVERTMLEDRIHYVPRHIGPNVFPNFFLFNRLVRLAHKEHLIAIKDLTYGITADYAQLLTDVLHFRNTLRHTLHSSAIARIDRGDEVYITLVGPAGYEFVVGFFALMALGAAIVPISPDLPVKEASYFVNKSQAVGIVSANKSLRLANDLETQLRGESNKTFKCVEIRPHILHQRLRPDELQVSSDAYLDLNTTGLVIFTSGTTGPPKGACKRRGFFHEVATGFADQYGLQEGDTVLHTLPVHHATGVTVTLIPFLQVGGCIEFKSGGFNVEWTWERFKQGGLTYYSGVPTIYMRLMQYYEQKLSKLPQKELQEYVHGIRGFRALLCGTSALPRSLQQKWTALRQGSPVLTRYGGTEFGNGFSVGISSKSVPDGSVGEKAPGIDLKLSNGDEGEVMMRSAIMFSKYLHDPVATQKAHNEDGYFMTGDIARREGKYYFILGRANIDIIKSGGYKISALDIERELLDLDYIAEAMVVGVEDEEFGQRVAAAIVLQPGGPEFLELEKLRLDLRETLAGYKMPTLTRIVPELRKNATGKVLKKILGPELFPPQGHSDVQTWHSKKEGAKL
jgi:malonyl-CoA/methylmalonyl-CoA synthetase